MLETCLNNKTIRDFLNNYETSRWKQLVPSLIEIAILNLNSSFNTVIFSEEDIKNIIAELKTSQNSKNTQSQKPKRDTHSHIIFSKPSNQWRTADGGVPPISGNKEKEFYFDNSSLTNTSKYNKDNKEIARENMMNKKIIKNTKSKIKEQVENDKKNYYNKVNGNNLNNINKPIEKINYAISYDKNLEPELIEKTTINNNKKGGKKIVEKMTQEEYEQKLMNMKKRKMMIIMSKIMKKMKKRNIMKPQIKILIIFNIIIIFKVIIIKIKTEKIYIIIKLIIIKIIKMYRIK